MEDENVEDEQYEKGWDDWELNGCSADEFERNYVTLALYVNDIWFAGVGSG